MEGNLIKNITTLYKSCTPHMNDCCSIVQNSIWGIVTYDVLLNLPGQL